MSRTKAEQAALHRDGNHCRRCGRSIVDFPASLHHRQPKGSGGGSPARYDRVENLITLCGSGTTGCHGWAHTATERYDLGWLVHRWDEPSEIPLIDLAGRTFFLTEEGTVIDLRRSQHRSTGEAGAGPIGGASPAAPDQNVGGGGQPDTPPPAYRKRKRWPIWSESQSGSICNICGWTGSHSSVCPWGPEPTRSRGEHQ
jgi:hypothetical protein